MRFKKLLSVIVSICIMFSFLIPAKAASLTTADKAVLLGKFAIFSSKDLTAQAKRFEAAVYAVRILGKEQLLNEGTYKYTKFTDVDSELWYAPYVGYCDEADLINDAQGDKFLPEQYISEKAFLSLILSTLGYSYNKDFTLSTVYKKAYDVGIVTDASYKTRTADNTKYKKSDIVNVLYNALGKEQKGTKVKLIQNLIYEKVIIKEDAVSAGILSDKVLTAISDIMVLDQDSIRIKLNEAVQSLTPENIKIYITGNPEQALPFTIKSQLEDGAIILDTDKLEAFDSYTIEFNNVKDIEGNEAGTLSSGFEGLQGLEIKSDFLKISKVVPVSKDCVNVYFTHPININSLIASCYEIYEGDKLFVKGSSQTLSVQAINGVDNGVSIYLKGSAFTKDTLYLLKINGNLISAYGVRMNDGSGDSIKFKGIENTAANNTSNNNAKGLDISSITLVDGQTVRLEFNMELTPTFAKQNINYYIADAAGTQISVKKAVLTSEAGKNNRIVLLSMDGSFIQTANYTLTIGYLVDITKQFIMEEKQYSFSCIYANKVLLSINSANSIDGNALKISFNKALDQESAENPINYSVAGVNHAGYSAVPAKVLYNPAVDPYSVILYLPASNPLLKDKVYMVNALSTLKDSLGNAAGSKISGILTCTNGTVTIPSVKEAVTISSDSIRVDFNKEIVLAEAAVLTSNYILQYVSEGEAVKKMPLGICIINKSRIILKFDGMDKETIYKLGFGVLEDYSGNSNSMDPGAQNAINVTAGK